MREKEEREGEGEEKCKRKTRTKVREKEKCVCVCVFVRACACVLSFVLFVPEGTRVSKRRERGKQRLPPLFSPPVPSPNYVFVPHATFMSSQFFFFLIL